MREVTIGIKTFERPDALASLLASLRVYYPTVKVLVADDGTETTKDVCRRWKATWLQMPDYDSGLAAGRNFLVQHTHTRFLALMDDDFVLTERTDLALLRTELEAGDYDLVAGSLVLPTGQEQHYEGWLWEEDGHLYALRVVSPGPTIPVMLALNFFLARTDALRRTPWDPELKVCEHEDWFWRACQDGLQAGYCPRVVARHERATNPDYAAHRNRTRLYRAQALAKHGWKEIVWVNA